MIKTSVAVICLTTKPLKGNLYPLYLRLTKDGKRKYISMKISIPLEQWDFDKNLPKRNCPDQDSLIRYIESTLLKYRRQIEAFREEGRDYSLSMLVNAVEKPTKKTTVRAFLDEHIAWLKSQKYVGYYLCSDDNVGMCEDFEKEIRVAFDEHPGLLIMFG